METDGIQEQRKPGTCSFLPYVPVGWVPVPSPCSQTGQPIPGSTVQIYSGAYLTTLLITLTILDPPARTPRPLLGVLPLIQAVTACKHQTSWPGSEQDR
jgi:hypothetical protein